MPKPKYIEDNERDKAIYEKANKCIHCIHIGKPHHYTVRRIKEKTIIFECAIHPGCYNTIYSIACEDYTERQY